MSRTATWSSMGTDVRNVKTLETVLNKSGLNYNIEKVPIFAGDSKIEIPGRVATVRKEDGKVYGIVSDSYEVCQNADAFDFVNNIKEDIEFVRAGETESGLVYLIAKAQEMNVLGDKFQPYIIFQNGHNGGYSIKAAISPLRIVCRNQFTMAFKESSNTVNIRHTSAMSDKLQDAQNVLRSINSYMETLNKEAEKYAGIKLSPDQVSKVIDEFFPITQEMGTRAVNSMLDKKDQFLRAYQNDDNGNFRGTVWGMINAASDYITHFNPNKKTSNWDENRFVYVTFNPAVIDTFIQKAMMVAGK